MNVENATIKKEKALTKAIKNMLKPLVRLLIHQNITYVGIQNLLKRTYVDVANESFNLAKKKQTDSRISLLTGIHRADVKRIRAEDPSQPTEKEIKASISAQIMSVWTGRASYNDVDGKPIPLVRYADDTTSNYKRSFEELVLSISKDKHPRSMVDDWLNQGVVEIKIIDDIEFVLLTEKGYVPESDFEEKLYFAGKNIGEHLEVVANNLEGEMLPMFDRAVYYDQLSQTSIIELEALAKNKMIAVLTEINQHANQLQEKDLNSGKATSSMHVGAYFSKHNDEKS